MKQGRQRFAHIDLLKTFGIFCVILIHSFWLRYDFWNEASVGSYINYFFRTILASSVPIFFLCSGYLMFSKELDIKKQLLKTGHYILITYIWAVLLIVVLMPIKNEYLSIGEMVNAIREWRLGWINHLWYMGPFVCIYMIFPVLKMAVERKKEMLIYFVVMVSVFVYGNQILKMVSWVEPDNAWMQSFAMFEPYGTGYDWTYVYFGMGGILYLYQERLSSYLSKYGKKSNVCLLLLLMVSCIGVFACGVVLSLSAKMHWDVVWEGYDTIFTLFVVVAIYGICLNYRIKEDSYFAKIVRVISESTLGIYFVHMLFIHITEPFLIKHGIMRNGVLLIPYVLLILGISTFTTIFIKKIPIICNLVK